MKSNNLGKNISSIEIHTSFFGVWLLVLDTEFFLPYKEYPWFQDAKISELYNVKLINETHIYWPSLDVDLELNGLINPEKYPLIYHNK
jgi:hypothetical protein